MRSGGGRAQLGEPAAHSLGSSSVFDRVRQQPQDFRVSTEVGEVFEGEVDGANERAGVAQFEELVVLALPAGHTVTMRRRADRFLPRC
jgi:hypothetical protein